MQAIILAAGMGKRLGNLTLNNTKCMVEVLGKKIIERTLENIINSGIKKVVLVVGFMADDLKRFVEITFPNLDVEYVYNPLFDKTNNIYSLFLAKEKLLEDDTILIESDLLFEDKLLKSILSDPCPNVVVVAKYENWMDGTVVTIDENEMIVDFIPKKKFDFKMISEYYKTVNIYKFDKNFSEKNYVPFLEAYTKSMGKNEYYEEVLRVIAFIERTELKALVLNKTDKWYEIDDIHDLENAEAIFADSELKLSKFQNRYGGYWRFPELLDFCYLVNPYFPNTKMKNEMVASFSELLGQYPSGQNIMKLLTSKIFGILPDELVVGNGATEIINAYFSNCQLKTGVILPTFEEYPNRISAKLRVEFTPQNKDFSYGLGDLIEFSKEIDQLLLINPDNPSGNFLGFDDIIKLLDNFKLTNKILILDESFVDFAEKKLRFTFLNSELLNQYPNLIVIKSISKSYGVPGLRLGVLASSNGLLISDLKAKLSIWNINSFAEYFLQIFDKYSKDYNLACDKISNARDILFEGLSQISFIETIPSQANYFLCRVLPPLNSKKITEDLLFLNQIFIKDCENKAGFNKQSYIRIAVRDENDNKKLIEALKRIDKQLIN